MLTYFLYAPLPRSSQALNSHLLYKSLGLLGRFVKQGDFCVKGIKGIKGIKGVKGIKGIKGVKGE